MAIRTTTDLIRAAAQALIRRDSDAILELAKISEGVFEDDAKARTHRLLWQAVYEAACWLQNEPSDVEHDNISNRRACF